MSLPEALERAAGALSADADAIRPANGDPLQLLDALAPESAPRVLDWMLRNEPEAADELAAAWSEHELGAAPLAAIEAAGLPKAGRKVLRRALHRMRSRGVEMPQREPATPTVARLPKLEEEIDRAFLTGLDPRGSRMILLVETRASGGLRLFQLVVDELRGIAECEVFSAGRSRIRGFLDDLRRKLTTLEVEPDSARALIARALERHPADRPLPRAFPEWRTRLAPGEGAATPGSQVRGALKDAEGVDGLRRARELVTTHAAGPWPPETAELIKFAERLKTQAESRLIVSGPARSEQIDSLLGEVAGEIFDTRFAAATAHRFEETAYMLWKAEREEDARACLAAATSLQETPASENEIARALLDVWLAPLLRELREPSASENDDSPDRGATDEEPALLVKP